MATARGRAEVSRYLKGLPKHITRVLHGAGRAGGNVIADEAKLRVRSDDVRQDIIVKTEVHVDRISVWITVKPGWGRSKAIWLEYGTAPHFISVDDSVRRGMTARRINSHGSAEHKATLVINGKGVGTTVHHTGAQPFPFLRPARDTKLAEAIAAIQGYLNARIGHNGGPDLDDGGEA